jgi:hypothetical protein
MSTENNIPLLENDEFHMGRYREIIRIAVDRDYRFVSFKESQQLDKNTRYCILRHDMDYMPEWCAQLAEAEEEFGVRSNWFFQTCAKTYNLREAGNVAIVRSLARAGHTIGLHVDLAWDPDLNEREIPDFIEEEKVLFEKITGIQPCDIISFHNPHRFADRIVNQVFEGVHHTYEPRYFSKIKYLSDSQGWYEGCASVVFAERRYPQIHLLLHPYIWPMESRGGYIENMAAMVALRKKELIDYLLKYNPACTRNADRLRELTGVTT